MDICLSSVSHCECTIFELFQLPLCDNMHWFLSGPTLAFLVAVSSSIPLHYFTCVVV